MSIHFPEEAFQLLSGLAAASKAAQDSLGIQGLELSSLQRAPGLSSDWELRSLHAA